VNVFTVDTERPVDPVSPADRLIIPFRGDAPVVSLQWNRGWFADSYRVEMARSSAFTEVPVVRDVTGSSVLIEDLAAGTWWWRVTPGYRRGLLDAPRSPQVRSFVLEQRTGHDPVRLVSPADGARLSGLEVREGIPFRWQSQDGLVSYRIRVSRNEGFTDVVAESDGPENWRTLLPAAEPDVYWWRVDGTSTDGLPVPESAVRRFEVQPITGSVELLDPAPGETKELEPFSSHTFLWRSGVPGTARFTLERRDAEARTRIIESLVNGESFTAPLPGEGTYVWSIQILDERGRPLVESPEGRFRLRSEFRAPTLVRPRPGDSVELVGATSLELGWNPSPGADAYRVVLRGPDGSIYGRDDRVSGLEREFSLPSAASPGRYEVELTALRDNPPAGASRSSETASYGFDIGSLVAYSAAVPVSPADGARIDALTALRSGVTLSWRQDPPLGRWTVELDNGAVTRLYQTTEPRLVLEGLDAAAYTWRIRSRDSFGQEAPDSRVARFTVTDLPAPPTPRVISPSPGENIDMTGARSLVFSWDRADGAEFYDLALYVEGSDEPLLRENGLRGTAYAVENLRILDVGDFVLDLRARTEYEDVGVTRTSPAARVPFSLSVNIASEAPKILTDELQYGG